MTPDQDDLRRHRRFVLDTPLKGFFGAADIGILNIGQRGLQAEHGNPLKPGSKARVIVTLPQTGEKIALRGTVVWSRFSKTPDARGRLLYRSGIHFDEENDFSSEALDELEARGVARLDTEALQRKQEALERKRHQRQMQLRSTPTPPASTVSPEHVLLIQHARDQLRANPEEAQKWYQRARFSPPIIDGQPMPYRGEVIAIWEYLQRSIDIQTVAKVMSDLK